MENEHEPEVTLESIDSALDNLVKAAEATEMVKAYGGTAVDSYGHVDERGKTKGGYADKGDMGGLDSMMIGKMEQTLVEAGFPAEAIAAYMKGDDDEEEEEEEEVGKFGKPADSSGSVTTGGRPRASGGGSPSAKMKGGDDDEDKPFGKSFDAFNEDPAIADAIDVSPFLEALVQRTSERLDSIAKSMHERGATQDEMNKSMAVAMHGIGQLVKGIATHAQRLDHRLGLVERQPMPPKGARTAPQAKAMAKSFGAYGTEGQGGTERLTKSQVLNTLSYLNLEKGVDHIGGVPTSELIYLYEGGGQLAPQALNAVQRFLSTNPGEAQLAKSYR